MSNRRRRKSPAMLRVGALLLVALCVLAAVAPWIWLGDANALTATIRGSSSASHPLGTDALGRDILARTLVATRLSILMAAGATAFAATLGTLIGAGVIVAGGYVRRLGNRFIDLIVAYPPIVTALAVTAILSPGKGTLVLAIGLAFTPQFARLTNTLANSVNSADYVGLARLVGLSRTKTLTRHVIPNILSPILVLLSVGFATSIVTLSGLSFIGLGVQAPNYDWGQLLADGLQSLYVNPIASLGPALGILIAGLAAGLVGDGLAQRSEGRGQAAMKRQKRRNTMKLARAQATADGVVLSCRSLGAQAPAVLSVTDLKVSRGSTLSANDLLVRGVSLNVHAGEIVGIVGESGSGKSLTAMAVARLLPGSLEWSAKEMKLADIDLSNNRVSPPSQLALELGIVFQDPSSCFNPALRIGTQLTEVLRKHRDMPRGAAEQLAIDRLREVRVSSPERRMKQYPYELSGGMRQRAMIAMSLLAEPKLLIADEPTTALDVTVQVEVLRLLKRINRDHGLAILFISHDIASVSALCTRVCVMYAGRIVEELTVQDLREGQVHHPYTQALLAASPDLVRSRQAPLRVLAGRPPGVGENETGCAFAPRCPLVVEKCHDLDPVLLPLGRGAVACHVAHAAEESDGLDRVF